jgi:hypothetical protein
MLDEKIDSVFLHAPRFPHSGWVYLSVGRKRKVRPCVGAAQRTAGEDAAVGLMAERARQVHVCLQTPRELGEMIRVD